MSTSKSDVYRIEKYKCKNKNKNQRVDNIENLLSELVQEMKSIKETLKRIEINGK